LKETGKEKDKEKDRRGPAIRGTIGRIAEAVSRTPATRQAAGEDKAREAMREALSTIHTVAFIGSSGTGKSTRALKVARNNAITYIIDDGLLIHGGRIVAGLSAKRANSRLESVRQALFVEEGRASVMRRSIQEQAPEKLMILGTSDGMIDRICENLWLPVPVERIHIEDVSTEDEIRTAVSTRMREGKHAIPVPSLEIKHEFSGYFSEPLTRLLRRRDRGSGVTSSIPAEAERTVVRPTFSSLGQYTISDEALRAMTELILKRVRGVAGLIGFEAGNDAYGAEIKAELSLYYGFNAQEVLREAQNRIVREIEKYTSINVMTVDVRARRVVHAPPPHPPAPVSAASAESPSPDRA
jgi:uncharacterized alkaline shock family protein YloU